MLNRKSLTKSLHTVSAVVNVVIYRADVRNVQITQKNAMKLIGEALDLLGQPGPWDESDPTVQQCVRVLLKRAGV